MAARVSGEMVEAMKMIRAGATPYEAARAQKIQTSTIYRSKLFIGWNLAKQLRNMIKPGERVKNIPYTKLENLMYESEAKNEKMDMQRRGVLEECFRGLMGEGWEVELTGKDSYHITRPASDTVNA